MREQNAFRAAAEAARIDVHFGYAYDPMPMPRWCQLPTSRCWCPLAEWADSRKSQRPGSHYSPRDGSALPRGRSAATSTRI